MSTIKQSKKQPVTIDECVAFSTLQDIKKQHLPNILKNIKGIKSDYDLIDHELTKITNNGNIYIYFNIPNFMTNTVLCEKFIAYVDGYFDALIHNNVIPNIISKRVYFRK